MCDTEWSDKYTDYLKDCIINGGLMSRTELEDLSHTKLYFGKSQYGSQQWKVHMKVNNGTLSQN